MPTAVRFTNAERELIRRVLENPKDFSAKENKAAEAILRKLELSELTKTKAAVTGIGWVAAAEAMRSVLGASLATPPSPDPSWMIRMNGRIRSLGLSAQDCRSIAQVLKAKAWKVYSFEKTIWAADTLLAEAQLEIKGTTLSARRNAPMEMGEL